MGNLAALRARGMGRAKAVSTYPEWSVARSHASRNEGLAFSFTVTASNTGRLARKVSCRLRRPDSVSGTLVTANTSDFDRSFADAVVVAVAAKNAAAGAAVLQVRRINENECELIGTKAWLVSGGQLEITRTSLNNPAATGNLFTGIEIAEISTGTITIAAIGTTIVDAGSISDPPENTSAPSLSDSTPAVGSAVIGSDGVWDNFPSSFAYKWQRQVSASDTPVAFTDNGNRANEVMTASASWSLAAGSAADMSVFNNGFGTAGAVGTVVLYTGSGSANHGVKFTVKTGSGPRERMILKWVDINNYIYVEVSKDLVTNGIRATRVVGGVATAHTFTTTARVSGATYEVTYYSGVLTLKINGVETGTSYTLSSPELTALGASTQRGMGTAADGGTPAFDNVVITDYVTSAAIGEDIVGATAASLTPTSSEQNLPIRFGVLPSNTFGPAADYAYSDWSAPVEAAPSVIAPVNVSVPLLSMSTPQVGVAVSCSTGTWDNNPTSFAFQWKNAGVAISGETSAVYTPVAGDVGDALSCTVTATNAGGSVSATSASSAAVIAEPVSDATDAFLSGPAQGPSVLIGASQGTRVATITGNGAINSVSIVGSGSFPFEVVEDGGAFHIDVATPPDFFGPSKTNYFGRTNIRDPISKYTLPLRFNASDAVPFDKSFPIRRKHADLATVITGGDGGAESSANTAAAIWSPSGILKTTSSTEIIHVPDHNVHGVLKHAPTTPNAKEDNGSNKTYVGHPGAIQRQGRGLQKKRGSNVKYQNIPFFAGGHQSTPEQYSLIDCREFGNMNIGETNVVKRLFNYHLQEYFSLDESDSLIGFGPYPREVIWLECELGAALHDRRQPGNIPHPYAGPLVHNFSDTIAIIKNLIHGGPMRSPRLTAVVGSKVQNNVIFGRPTNTTGHSIMSVAGPSSGGVESHIAADFASNIIIIDSTVNYDTAIQTAMAFLDVPAGSEVNLNIGVPGKENFIVRMVGGAPDWAHAVPLSLAHCRAQGTRTVNPLPIVNYDTCEWDTDFDHMASGTMAELIAIYDDRMENAGSRRQVGDVYTGDFRAGDENLNRAGYVIRQSLRTSGSCGYPTIALLDGWYNTDWAGGGSLGFGMHYLHNGTTWTEGGV